LATLKLLNPNVFSFVNEILMSVCCVAIEFANTPVKNGCEVT